MVVLRNTDLWWPVWTVERIRCNQIWCIFFLFLCISLPLPSLSLLPPFFFPFWSSFLISSPIFLFPPELQSVPLLARSPSTNRKYPPLPIDKLEEEMNRRMADDNKLFREEFNVWLTHTHTLYISHRQNRCQTCIPTVWVADILSNELVVSHIILWREMSGHT